MPISRLAVRDFLSRDLEDFRWMKGLRRGALERHVAQLRVRPQFRTEPWLHQLVCFYIGLHYPRFLMLLDMGAGKTKIISDLFTQMRREGRVRRALVGVPRLVNVDTWQDDLAEHSDLEPWLIGSCDVEEKRARLLRPQGDVTVVPYQGLQLALSKKDGRRLVRDDAAVRKAMQAYDFIALDESHLLSAPPGAKAGGRDGLWFSILRMLTRDAHACFGSTGTLFGKDPTDLWSQFYLIDRGETFGENLGIFRTSFFDQEQTGFGAKWVYDRSKALALNRMLQHRSIRYESAEMHDLPLRVPRRRALKMAGEQREHYMRALEGLINASGELRECKAQWLRMRQICSGYIAWTDETGDHAVRLKENPKLDWLEGKLDEMGDSKVVVSHEFTESGRMVTEMLARRGIDHVWLWGGAKDKTGLRRRFLDDPRCRVMVMNSAAGGTGNDGLQKVARYMVFYESPTSPTARIQTEKRIHRPGQPERSFVWDPVMDRSLEGGILASIAEGVDVHDCVVNGKMPSRTFLLTEAPRR